MGKCPIYQTEVLMKIRNKILEKSQNISNDLCKPLWQKCDGHTLLCVVPIYSYCKNACVYGVYIYIYVYSFQFYSVIIYKDFRGRDVHWYLISHFVGCPYSQALRRPLMCICVHTTALKQWAHLGPKLLWAMCFAWLLMSSIMPSGHRGLNQMFPVPESINFLSTT